MAKLPINKSISRKRTGIADLRFFDVKTEKYKNYILRRILKRSAWIAQTGPLAAGFLPYFPLPSVSSQNLCQ